jgi:amino acid transporter
MEKNNSHLVVGAIIGSILILLNVLLILLGYNGNTKVSWVLTIINIGLLVYFIQGYGKSNDFEKSFGELFTYGFKSTAFATILLTAFMIIYSFIFPEESEKSIQIARQEMESKQNLTEDQIEQSLELVKKFYFPILIAGTLFGTLMVGGIGSLIGAWVTKKKPLTPFS